MTMSLQRREESKSAKVADATSPKGGVDGEEAEDRGSYSIRYWCETIIGGVGVAQDEAKGAQLLKTAAAAFYGLADILRST